MLRVLRNRVNTGVQLRRLAYSVFFGRLNYTNIAPNYCILFQLILLVFKEKQKSKSEHGIVLHLTKRPYYATIQFTSLLLYFP